MLADYAWIVRRSAAVAAVAGAIMIGLGASFGGTKGLVGAGIGVGLVAVFFGASVLAVGWAARISPPAMMATALATYFVKIVILLFLAGRFQNSTTFNPRVFGLTAIVCILAYTGAQVLWTVRRKMLYVQPDRER